MSIKVIVDSTCDLLDREKERVSAIVPLTVRFGQEEFLDGKTINHQQFYEKLVNGDAFPSTSQANPDSFASEYEKIDKNDQVIVITLSKKLSGTYQSAVIAAEDYDNVYVVDSESVAIGTGVLVEYIFQLIDQGYTCEQILIKIEEYKKKIVVMASLDTLEYLKRGGRISKTAAVAGGLLNIKPVLAIKDGEIVVLGKARGLKVASNLLEKEIEKNGGVDYSLPVLLGYTGNSDEQLKKYISDSERLWKDQLTEVRYTVVGCAIGTHAGPGAVAVAFFKKGE